MNHVNVQSFIKNEDDVMEKKLEDIIGDFEEVDQGDECKLGKFLRVKTPIDLRNPFKIDIVVLFQNKNIKIFFKYECLLNFCKVCGKISQVRDTKVESYE